MKSNISADLHALIHSMSQHEKRYFKLYAELAGKRTSNNYLDLYEGLNRMKVYSDEKITAWTAGKRYAKSFPSTVHHLFSLLLRSLKSCHAEKKISQEIRSLMESARLLMERDLHRAAMRLVKRAVKKAQQAEACMELAEALALERKLLFRLRSKSLYEEVEDHKVRTLKILVRLKEELHLEAVQDQHRALRMRRLDPRAASQATALQHLMEDPLLGEEPPEGFKAALAYHGIKGNNSLLQRDHEEAYRHLSTAVLIWEAHPQHRKEFVNPYLNDLTDLLNACLYSMRWLTAERVLEKISSLVHGSLEQKRLMVNQVLYTALILHLNAGRYASCTQVIAQIETMLAEERMEVPETRKLNYYFNITIFHFIQEDYQEAARWLNKILHASSGKLKQHLRDFARLFQLVLQYELGNLDLVEYLFRSAYRYYKTRDALYQFEKTVFEAIKRMIQGEVPIPEIASGLYESLWEIARQLEGKEPTGIYELIFWAQSKFEGRTLKAVFQGRVDERMALVEAKEGGADGETLQSLQDRELK